MSYVFNALEVIDVTLQFVLIFLLIRGPFRKYLVFSIYAIAILATTIVEVGVTLQAHPNAALFRKIYWSDEVLTDLLLFLTVISLIYLALESSPLRGKTGRLLAGIVVIVLILPFILFHAPFLTDPRQWTPAWGKWFNSTSQILNFGAAIMNLGLWTALLSSKRRDGQLIMVSIGLGVAVAGQAIGFGVRHFIPDSSALRQIPDLFMSLTHAFSVFLWCRAFWRSAPTPPVTEPVTSS